MEMNVQYVELSETCAMRAWTSIQLHCAEESLKANIYGEKKSSNTWNS